MDSHLHLNKVSTGIELIDKKWGGFYRGATYLLLGPKKSGRSLLGLQYALEGLKKKEVSLYFTSMRPKDITILASTINFDIQSHMNENELVVVKVAAPVDLADYTNPDSYLVDYFTDILSVIEQYNPDRLIFDDLTPFVTFDSQAVLRQTFLKTVEGIEERNITSFFILSEPAGGEAQKIVDAITEYVTGVIYMQKTGKGVSKTGTITITPNVGHTEGQFASEYVLDPGKGIKFVKNGTKTDDSDVTPRALYPEGERTVPDGYTPLSDIDPVKGQFTFSNIYDINEFLLILNNQIALYKSTGQPFTLVALKLDKAAEAVISLNQLQSIVRLSTDKKDKICIYKGNVVILFSQADEKQLNVLVSNVSRNLLSSEQEYLDKTMSYIYANQYVVDDNAENANSILEGLLK